MDPKPGETWHGASSCDNVYTILAVDGGVFPRYVLYVDAQVPSRHKIWPPGSIQMRWLSHSDFLHLAQDCPL